MIIYPNKATSSDGNLGASILPEKIRSTSSFLESTPLEKYCKWRRWKKN